MTAEDSSESLDVVLRDYLLEIAENWEDEPTEEHVYTDLEMLAAREVGR